jgi:hypothetical protein
MKEFSNVPQPEASYELYAQRNSGALALLFSLDLHLANVFL